MRGRVGTPDARYTVRYAGAVSNQVALAVRPGLDTAFSGSGRLGTRALPDRPRAAGRGGNGEREASGAGIASWPAGRSRAACGCASRTGSAGAYRIRLTLHPATGLPRRKARARANRLRPVARHRDRRPERLRARPPPARAPLRARPRSTATTARTTSTRSSPSRSSTACRAPARPDARFWGELQRATSRRRATPAPTSRSARAGRCCFVVRNGEVALVVQVSTGATGNTPLGHWRVYSKVPGFNAMEMYYSSFFVGAFAIHGYHSVPPYPASHGCVRIPIWVAPRIYSLVSYGTTSTSTGRAAALAAGRARRGGLARLHARCGERADGTRSPGTT